MLCDHIHICGPSMTEMSLCYTWQWCRTALKCLYLIHRRNVLALILLTCKIWWAPNNARRWQTGFNLAFKGLMSNIDVCVTGWWYSSNVVEEHLQMGTELEAWGSWLIVSGKWKTSCMIPVDFINTLKLKRMWFATWEMKSSVTCDLAFIKRFVVIYVVKNLPVHTANGTD